MCIFALFDFIYILVIRKLAPKIEAEEDKTVMKYGMDGQITESERNEEDKISEMDNFRLITHLLKVIEGVALIVGSGMMEHQAH